MYSTNYFLLNTGTCANNATTGGGIAAAIVYRSGVLVQIPRPERFAIHKLIIADRRQGRDALKARKDLAQAEFLITALAQDRPDDLAEAYNDAASRGPKWRERLERPLGRSEVAA